MPVTINGLLEDVQEYEGKNGFGANVTISQKIGKKTKRITFIIKDKSLALRFSDLLDCEVSLCIAVVQNNFGTRFGDVYSIQEADVA